MINQYKLTKGMFTKNMPTISNTLRYKLLHKSENDTNK